MQVKLSDVTLPKHYIRGKAVISKQVDNLMAIVAGHNGVKPEEWKKLVGKKSIEWPFPALDISPVKEDETKKEGTAPRSKAKKKTLKKTFKYEINDGGHRFTVAKRLKMPAIEATIKNLKPGLDRYLEQYRTNLHGLQLDKDQRDDFIRTCVQVFGAKQRQLAKDTGLDEASISRIIHEKQRIKGPRKKATKRERETFTGNGADDTSTIPPAEMSVAGFLERLQILMNEVPRLQTKLLEHSHTMKKPALEIVFHRLCDLAAIFDPQKIEGKKEANNKKDNHAEHGS
jgi:hypothetical protein